MLYTIISFLFALAILVAVHEYGHYRVAVACGVKVLRFSIGFGKVICRWTPKNSETEFVLSWVPLGGYVAMLGEQDPNEPVAEHEKHRTFASRPLWAKAAIVAAGPVANLLLAIVIYSALNWWGAQEPAPILERPAAQSMAQAAGIEGGEYVQRAALQGDELMPVRSFNEIRWLATRAALEQQDLQLELSNARDDLNTRTVVLPLSQLRTEEIDARLYRAIGISGPRMTATIGELTPGGAGERSGLQNGDMVLRVDEHLITDAAQLREIIRSAQHGSHTQTQKWDIRRNDQVMTLSVTPELKTDASGQSVARIEALVGAPPEMVHVSYGPWEGFVSSLSKTWDMSALSVRTIGRMIIGEVSLKNLSGPITIADYAGKSAQNGLIAYLSFVAFVSISLGVLNLMPIPMLDGAHLLYYLWEGVTGRAVSQVWMQRFQRGGLALILAMMSIAFFNDIMRLLS